MDLTPENKAAIDSKSYTQLLSIWIFAPVGDLWFQGETGKYWYKRIIELRNQPGGNEKHVAVLKQLRKEVECIEN